MCARKVREGQLREDIRALLGPGVDIKELRRIHKGFHGESYELKTNDDTYFVKRYIKRDYVEPEFKNTGKLIEREVAFLEQLNCVRVKGIRTARVVCFDISRSLLVQEFVTGTSFYYGLLKMCNLFIVSAPVKDLFASLGRFLAEFHNAHFVEYDDNDEPCGEIHGDLNNKNIMFAEGSMCILDPGPLEKLDNISIYRDIARVIMLFFPFIPLLGLLFNRKGTACCRRRFVESYIAHSDFSIDREKIKKYVLQVLSEHEIKRSFKSEMRNYFIAARARAIRKRIVRMSTDTLCGRV